MNTVCTIGHGDRSIEDLLACLASFGVEVLADVRSWPASRHHPHFDRDRLEPAIAGAGLVYRFLGRELGGLRSSGYQAHMETDLFREGFEKLLSLAGSSPVAIFCSERDPAGCHRRHLSARLEAEGFLVRHIIAPGRELLPGERPGDQGTLFPI